MLRLVDADKKYLDGYSKAYQESLKKVEKGEMKRHNLMFLNPEELDVVKHYQENRDITKLPAGYVPSYDYFLVDGEEFIGIIHIRTNLTERLLRYGGHIGYGIHPKFWKQGYGTKLLQMGLEKGRDLITEDDILLTCDDDNIGSSKIIESNGGVLENKTWNEDRGEKFLTKRYWIHK